jgi:spore coat polysaccharide biosynthesis predicted glycosyltransferase SpsG
MATRTIAASLGWMVVDVESDYQLRQTDPALVVVDDPSGADIREWVQRARRLGVPVATIHDLGRDYLASDLIVDGSIQTSAPPPKTDALLGPEFAILHPAFATAAKDLPPQPRRVLIALGGGGHVRQVARRLCSEIALRVRGADVHVARGFVSKGRDPVLPAGRWVSAPDGLAIELSQAAAAVVAGGVTLYEACALGVPVVGLAVTAAQHLTVRSMAIRGAVIDAGRPPSSGEVIARTADSIAKLLSDERLGRQYSKAARALVDGRGALRVAERLRRLMTKERGTRAA